MTGVKECRLFGVFRRQEICGAEGGNRTRLFPRYCWFSKRFRGEIEARATRMMQLIPSTIYHL
jgi:hypothetical protein